MVSDRATEYFHSAPVRTEHNLLTRAYPFTSSRKGAVMRNRNVNRAIYIPIEVIVAHIAGVSTAGDFTAAKRIFAGRCAWWYPRSTEPKVTTVWEEWANGSAAAAGQGAIDFGFLMPDAARPSASIGVLRPPSARPESRPPLGLGQRPGLRQRIESEMLEALDSGTILLDELVSEPEEALAKRWGVSRRTVREARKAVLVEKDANRDAAMRVFERHVRDREINVCQIKAGGLPWSIPSGLWRPGSLKRWTGGLVLDGGPYYWGKIFPNLEVLVADAESIYPGCRSEAASHERTPTPTRPSRGPRPKKSEAVERAMCEQIERGTLSIDELRRTKEEALAAEHRCSRTTVRRAIKSVLRRTSSTSE
jgi:hypothetical protein